MLDPGSDGRCGAPLVTCIIPTFDRWPMVAEAVASALANGDDVEVVVVDDGSRDESAEKLRETFPQVTVLQQENAGRSAARNAGLRVATGDFVAFLDSDDVLEPWHVEQLRDALRQGAPAQTAVYSAPVLLWDPGTGQTRSVRTPTYLPHDLRLASLAGTVLTLPGLLVPRQVALRIGGFSESLQGSEDWVFAARLASSADVRRLERPSVRVRTHGGRSMADVAWDLEWRDAATTWLLGSRELGLGEWERRLVRAGTARYRAARRYETGDLPGAREELHRVVGELGLLKGARWTGRLWVLTRVPGPLRRLLRRLR